MAVGQIRRSGRFVRAFTLVELLVVIGIIAILISVLLPVLGQARRAGATVKCAASLHQIGDAFKMYAAENKDWWPIVKWAPVKAKIAPGAPEVLAWQDFLFPYLNKGTAMPLAKLTADTFEGGQQLRTDLGALRGKSPIWGCPAFSVDEYYDPSNDLNRYSTGYGMSYHPAAPYTGGQNPLGDSNLLCLFLESAGGPYAGRFYTRREWAHGGSSSRGVICDSNWYWIWANPRLNLLKSTVNCDPFFDGQAGFAYIKVDGNRHLKPGTKDRQTVLRNRGINMLFVDGHVSAVSPIEAFIATMGGGLDVLK